LNFAVTTLLKIIIVKKALASLINILVIKTRIRSFTILIVLNIKISSIIRRNTHIIIITNSKVKIACTYLKRRI
jgi:hypothetical protein